MKRTIRLSLCGAVMGTMLIAGSNLAYGYTQPVKLSFARAGKGYYMKITFGPGDGCQDRLVASRFAVLRDGAAVLPTDDTIPGIAGMDTTWVDPKGYFLHIGMPAIGTADKRFKEVLDHASSIPGSPVCRLPDGMDGFHYYAVVPQRPPVPMVKAESRAAILPIPPIPPCPCLVMPCYPYPWDLVGLPPKGLDTPPSAGL